MQVIGGVCTESMGDGKAAKTRDFEQIEPSRSPDCSDNAGANAAAVAKRSLLILTSHTLNRNPETRKPEPETRRP